MLPDSTDRLLAATRPGRNRAHRHVLGFTLIELMITVAIVGILAAIAYPSYMNSVLKSRRAEGRTALIDLMQQQERLLTQRGTYEYPMTAASPLKTFSGDSTTKAAYDLNARACVGGFSPRECVQVYATPRKTDSDVGEINLTSTGLRSCGVPAKNLCW